MHLRHGAKASDAIRSVLVDYRVAMACPGRGEGIWRFVHRDGIDFSAEDAIETVCARGAFPSNGSQPGGQHDVVIPERTTPTPGLTEDVAELRSYMLQLINQDRTAHGLAPVGLGTNTAAQQHAEDMFGYRYLSHWGRDGLKPYMRYTLAGGTGYSAENVSGMACPRKPGAPYAETPARELVQKAQQDLMNSPAHRKNILDKWHKLVNLGIACDTVGCSIDQLFEGDYVDFWEPPRLFLGSLSLVGQLSDGFDLVNVQVWYEEPPHSLTFGQLGRTHSYSLGEKPAVFIREPPPPDHHYSEESTEYSWESGADPYSVDPRTPRPRLIVIGDVEGCDMPPPSSSPHTAMVPWVTADIWETEGTRFRIEADLGEVIESLGPGVYTIVIWGKKDGEIVGLTNYSVFVE